MEDMYEKFEIVIVGGTPGGLSAAIAAARLGRSVAVVESHNHIGGMTASGLGKSDVALIQSSHGHSVVGGIFKEFTQRIYEYYRNQFEPDSEDLKLCRQGLYYEPSIAEKIFRAMIQETGKISLMTGYDLENVLVQGNTVKSIKIKNHSKKISKQIEGFVFIDATYEGDLYAKAGADYLVGREGKYEFHEPHAGVIYYDYENGIILPESTGEGDDGIQAYTYRYCFTKDPRNSRILDAEPPDYNRNLYTPYFEDLKAGRLSPPKEFHEGWGYYPEHFDTLVRALSVTDLPNRKVDANTNPRPLAFPFPEENKGYVEGDKDVRERICERHKNIALGLIWFLQNDKEIPEKHRQMAGQYHLPLDEFTDNDNFPFQLYVREARRLRGEYTMTQHDVSITDEVPEVIHHPDTIAMGDFPIDSFPVRKKPSNDGIVLEGYLGMLDQFSQAYEIPYRAMIPTKLDGIIVPVALSATHVAFSSIRMEPTWMSLGEAAGVAAHVCIENRQSPRNASVGQIRDLLQKQGQILSIE